MTLDCQPCYNRGMAQALQASTALLVQQWQNSPKFIAAVDAPLTSLRQDVIPAFTQIELERHIDTATGVWLDYLGARVGLDRPSVVVPNAVTRFGFESATNATGFDRAPFRGKKSTDPVEPISDEFYRALIKARGLFIFGDGTFQTFFRACRFIDPACTVRDNRNMSVTIQTLYQSRFELADLISALPRTAGVQINYTQPGLFGFESSTGAVGFDQGPFRGSGG